MKQSGLGRLVIIISVLLTISASILNAQKNPNMTIFNTDHSGIPDNVVRDIAIDK